MGGLISSPTYLTEPFYHTKAAEQEFVQEMLEIEIGYFDTPFGCPLTIFFAVIKVMAKNLLGLSGKAGAL